MTKKIILLLAAALVIFATAQTSSAALNAVGPIDPAHGFPQWYQDSTGLALAPCFTIFPADPVGNPYCVLLADPFFNDTLPVAFPTNFPTEFFYWFVEADPVGGSPFTRNIQLVRLALEGTFANLPTIPVNGQQTTFVRIRIRFTPPSTGTYVFKHPYGEKTYAGSAGVQIRDTLDVPLGVALDFAGLLAGPVGPFLVWDSALPAPPAGYIGDVQVPHTVTGSPIGRNFIQMDGPNIGGPGINTVSTDLFRVAGMISPVATPTPLGLNRSSYGKSAAGTQVDVFATSSAGAAVAFDQLDTGATTTMGGDGSGRYFGESLPTVLSSLTVTVSAVKAPNDPASVAGSLIDVVTVTLAEYSLSTQTLTVGAVSSDQVGAPTLTAINLGDLTAGSLVMTLVLAPPGAVTVSSSLGGKGTRAVKIVP